MRKRPTRALLHKRLWLLLSLLLAWSIIYLPGLGQTIIKREQELRVALTARAMAEGGSWLIPKYGGALRLRKPPLMYWIVASAYKVADSTHSLVAARLPSTLAAAALAWTTFLIGSATMGRRRAWLSAIVLLSSFIVAKQGRSAETDVTLTLFTSIAIGLGFVAMNRADPVRWWLGAGVAGGLGFMTKGLAALALPPVAWLAFALMSRHSWKRLVSPAVIPGLLAFAVIVLPWYAAIRYGVGADTAAEQQMESEFTRMVAEKHHPGPFYYYLYTSLHAYAPWSILLPIALVLAVRRAWHHQGVRFIVLWFASTFVTLSLLTTKQIHYATLLACPASLLMGWMLGFADSRTSSWRSRIASGFISTLLAVFTLGGIALIIQPWFPETWPSSASMIAGALILAVASTGLVFARNSFPIRVLAVSLAIGCATAFQSMALDQSQKRTGIIPDFAQETREIIAASSELYLVGDKDAVMEFYVYRPVLRAASVADAWENAKPGAAILFSGNWRGKETPLPPEAKPLMQAERGDFVVMLFQKPALPQP